MDSLDLDTLHNSNEIRVNSEYNPTQSSRLHALSIEEQEQGQHSLVSGRSRGGSRSSSSIGTLSNPHRVSQTALHMDISAGTATMSDDDISPRSAKSSLHSQHRIQSSSSASDMHSTSLDRTRNGRRPLQLSENDGYRARPNSIVSIYQHDLSRKSSGRSLSSGDPSLQQQDQKKKKTTTKKDKEPNESFDRICSLLTHLITDASTAVGSTRSGDGNVVTTTAAIMPLVYAESESSDDDEQSEEKVEQQPLHQHFRNSLTFDDRDLRSLDSRVSRTRSRGVFERNTSKRQSLFMELQSCEPGFNDQGGVADSKDEEPVVERGNATQEMEHSSDAATVQANPSEDSTVPEDVSSHEAGLSLPANRGLKRRASFPTMRSEMVEIQNAGELREAIETMDAELDRTVETIDGLTKDLMAVATHQSWMQTRLEENLQLQGMNEDSLDDQSLENGRPSMSSDRTVPCQEEDDWIKSAPWNKSDPTDCPSSVANGDSNKRLSSRDFTQYFEALGKIAAMGQELEDRDRTLHRGLMFSDLDDTNHRKGNISQRSSGSSYTLNNDDFSFPVSPSECLLETLFDAKLDSSRGTSMNLKKVGVETLSMSIQDAEIKESFRPATWFTSLGWPRWRKPAMPANWPTTSPERPAELEEDGLSLEGAAALTNLLNMYVYLGLLFFWTLAFAAAVLFVVPSLAELSGQRARGLLAQVQKLLASPSEDQENSQAIAWSKPLLSSHRRYHSAGQGLRHGSRNRRKLNHQRIRRNLMTGSKADFADASKTALLRGKLATLNEESWSSKVSVSSLSSETTAAANTSAIFEDWE